MVKNQPAMQETWVRSLGWENPLEVGMATYSSILAWRIPMDRRAWWATVHGVAQSQTRLKQLITHVIIIHSYFTIVVCLFFLFLLSIYFWYLSLFASLYPLRVNLSYTHCSLFSAISLMSAEKPPDHQSFLYLGKVPTHSPFSRRSLIVTDIWSGFACLFPVCLSSDTMLVT